MSNIGLTEWECEEIKKESQVTKQVFGVPFNILDKLKKIVQEAWDTSERLRQDGFWNDHIAVQSAIAVYKAPDPTTGLTHAQRERLEMLAEEAAEIVQACTKILRHGYGSFHPDNPADLNRYILLKELTDLWAVYERMALHHDLPSIDFLSSGKVWANKMKWTHHQPEFHDPMDRGE
jgi:hypothetical protein